MSDSSPTDSKGDSAESPVPQPRPKRPKRRRKPKSAPSTEATSPTDTAVDDDVRSLNSDASPPPDDASNDVSIPMKSPNETTTDSLPEKKWHWTARVPGQILPTVVGPVGLGLCWKKMATAWGSHALEVVSWVILGWTVLQMTCLLGLMVYRTIRYPSIAILEQKHPTHFIFGIIATLYLCLISSFVINWNQIVAEIFWYVGFALMCLYMIYSLCRMVSQRIPVAQLNSFYLFGPLPVLLATQLAPYAPRDLLFFGWSTGTLWFFALHTLLLFRWIHIGLPRKAERAAMWLLLAASSDSVLSYVAAAKDKYTFGEPAKAIFFFSLLQFGVLISLSHRIFASGFVSTWWMTALPSSAFASSWIAWGLAEHSTPLLIVGTCLAGAATLWIMTLYLLTAVWIRRKKFWPKSPYRPPVDTIPLA